MNKNFLRQYSINEANKSVIEQIVLIMKLAIVILICLTASVHASVRSQTLSIQNNDASIKQLIAEIEKQTNYRFMYQKGILDDYNHINIKVKEAPLKTVLDIIFKNKPFKYQIYDGTVTISKNNTTNIIQNEVHGRVVDQNNNPLVGVSVSVVNKNTATVTNEEGTFSLKANIGDVIQLKYLGLQTQVITIAQNTLGTITMLTNTDNDLDEVVVVGYGTVRKKDLTGSVSSLGEKDFNKGVFTAPDQLLQGKMAGVQMTNNSGQPGGGTTVKIRGSSAITGNGQPLYVVDGVALSGGSARPNASFAGLGSSPSANPLNFINPNDIESIDVLKDASATAIYGARAAYGVVLITTKKAKSGDVKVDLSASTGISNLARPIKMLDGEGYRAALKKYNLSPEGNDYGADNVNALDAITRIAPNQNYNISLNSGKEDAKYRLSLGYQDQQGIIKDNDFKKYTAGINGNFRILDSKKLGVDVSLITSQTKEKLPPISTDAGDFGNLILQALTWNPTRSFYKPQSQELDIVYGQTVVNPLAMLAAYSDKTKTTTILGSISPYYKITSDLEYRFTYGVNYELGNRRSSIRSTINLRDVQPTGNELGGIASIGNNENLMSQFTHTLNYNKKLDNLYLSALAGYEYVKFDNKSSGLNGSGFGDIPFDYVDVISSIIQPANRGINSFSEPLVEIQSFFARATFNLSERYLLTATLRRDGSSKFGSENKYGMFPSFSTAWNISEEDFFNKKIVNQLKLRAGWGKTGNQEFPSGASGGRYSYAGSDRRLRQINNPNPFLKWQADEQINIGLDFGILQNRINGSVDYFNKTTTDLLFPQKSLQPASPDNPVTWINLPANIKNNGFEMTLNGDVIKRESFNWNLGLNATFIKNKVRNFTNQIITGSLNGTGLSGVSVEKIVSDYPLYSFFLPVFEGFDSNGIATYTDNGNILYYAGNPNPRTLLGISSSFEYKKCSLVINFNGAFGHKIYNNTANVIGLANITQTRNIPESVLNSNESPGNSVKQSTRYLESGDYLKLANAMLNYRVGNIANVIKNLNVFVTGQNLLLFTKYTGFDPEVNTNKSINGTPSLGIDYIGYPSSRTFNLGVNFSL